jgi:HSP20 family protein
MSYLGGGMTEKKKKVKWFWEKEPNGSGQMQKTFHEMKPFGFGFEVKFPKTGLEAAAPVNTWRNKNSAKFVGIDIPTNISETDKELIIRAELPGFKKDEIKIAATKTAFELTAEKKHEEIERGETFYRKEASHKAIHRAFTLPVPVNPEHVHAKLEEGILTVTLQKLETEKKRKKKVEIE